MTARTLNHADLRPVSARGLALLEVIVAMMVLTVGIVSVSKSFSVAVLARGLAQDYTDSRCLAARLIWESVAQAKSLQVGTTRGRFGDEWRRFSWEREVSRTSLPYFDPARLYMMVNLRGLGQRGGPNQPGGPYYQRVRPLQPPGSTRPASAFEMRGSDDEWGQYGTDGQGLKPADVFSRVVVTIRWKRRGLEYERSVATLVQPVIDKKEQVL